MDGQKVNNINDAKLADINTAIGLTNVIEKADSNNSSILIKRGTSNEGGEINLQKASNSNLTRDVTLDTLDNSFRISSYAEGLKIDFINHTATMFGRTPVYTDEVVNALIDDDMRPITSNAITEYLMYNVQVVPNPFVASAYYGQGGIVESKAYKQGRLAWIEVGISLTNLVYAQWCDIATVNSSLIPFGGEAFLALSCSVSENSAASVKINDSAILIYGDASLNNKIIRLTGCYFTTTFGV